MNKEYYRNKIFLGDLTLNDLWEMGLLEGLMEMNGNDRITAGKNHEEIEFCGPGTVISNFPASSKVKLNTAFAPKWSVDFNGQTLILSKSMDSYFQTKEKS